MCKQSLSFVGFECRCGGLYCAIHRYSDKHECTFDYREHGAAEIRRNNPVVVGEKIQKIWTRFKPLPRLQFHTLNTSINKEKCVKERYY